MISLSNLFPQVLNKKKKIIFHRLTLMTKVLPQEMATGNIHKGIMAGKLNGAIPAVTPSGSR